MRDSVEALYRRYRAHSRPVSRGKIVFHGVEGLDVYNPSAPFQTEGRWCIAARVEARESEFSKARFFAWDGGNSATLLTEMPGFDLQDPFISQIEGQLLFGGVKVAAT
ncbi:MAG: DUF1861 family protein, partial [Kluyvera sp.]